MTEKTAFLGSAFYSTDEETVKYIEKGLFCIDEKGFIENVIEKENPEYENLCAEYRNNGKLKVLSENEVMLPGFADLHIHAPQWPQSGTALDRPLEIWLNEYTFPLEAKYKDLDFAEKVYTDVVKTTLKYGTTTAVYFATVDREPSVLLAKICGRLGQRGLVGKVVMDDSAANESYYMDKSTDEAIAETEKFIKDVLAIQDDYKQKVYPVVTPRFVPSCTVEGLKGLGELVKKYDVHVQTHCSESDWEHGFVKSAHSINDAQLLDKCGLLTNKTVLAHAPFLEEEDIKTVAERKSSIAHCPLSNAYFAGAVLPFKAFAEKGINNGMATDISGGYSPSMYSAIRQAVVSSRMLNTGVNPALAPEKRGVADSALTLNRAFYSATVAGGKALDLPIGKLEKGYAFDVQVINLSENIPMYYPEKSSDDLLHKILLLSESSNIKEVWVQGEQVK